MPNPFSHRILTVLFVAGFLFAPRAARAENRIIQTFGDSSSMCDGPSRLLREYAIATRHWHDLKNQNADPREIQDAKSAIDTVSEALDPELAGVVVVVEKIGPQKFTPNVPRIEIKGQSKNLAQVVVVGVEPNSNQYSLTQERTQMRVDFRLLGVCSFLSPGTPLTRRTLQRAVDALLGN